MNSTAGAAAFVGVQPLSVQCDGMLAALGAVHDSACTLQVDICF